GIKNTLSLHELRDGEEYYLGVFLVGAYQETLGDFHNLLGATNVVSIRVTEDGNFEFMREERGDSIADMLSYVSYDPRRILEDLRQAAENSVRAGRISPADRFRIMQAFEDGLRGYTYFER
ncbi:MAG: arginine decarboxylase, partial [Desulfovibrionaceae bacterium]|nr:arginine decarboxylase [Desulfovibrionaceae bacterium]